MTPKEKAQQLFEKFMKPIDGLHKYPMCFDTAKQCALIAVDEITDVLVDLSFSEFTLINDVVYWNEVKQEIEKL